MLLVMTATVLASVVLHGLTAGRLERPARRAPEAPARPEDGAREGA